MAIRFWLRPWPWRSPMTRSARQVETGSALPFRSTSPTASKTMAPEAARTVA